MDNGQIELEEVFTLMDDGLVFESKSKSSFGDMVETAVYDKL